MLSTDFDAFRFCSSERAFILVFFLSVFIVVFFLLNTGNNSLCLIGIHSNKNDQIVPHCDYGRFAYIRGKVTSPAVTLQYTAHWLPRLFNCGLLFDTMCGDINEPFAANSAKYFDCLANRRPHVTVTIVRQYLQKLRFYAAQPNLHRRRRMLWPKARQRPHHPRPR